MFHGGLKKFCEGIIVGDGPSGKLKGESVGLIICECIKLFEGVLVWRKDGFNVGVFDNGAKVGNTVSMEEGAMLGPVGEYVGIDDVVGSRLGAEVWLQVTCTFVVLETPTQGSKLNIPP